MFRRSCHPQGAYTSAVKTDSSLRTAVCAKKCRSILLIKYIIYRTVHLFVLIESVNQFTMHGYEIMLNIL